uniref:Uncharacterized protein n=1 Tax=Picea glauca TaxID=3330 RepID=A0A101M006_PICGL|nr:hypothetical protein ABT39_MTgene5390 [Picea glauca]QHR91090.1 hypothetical protein Q903MT_gene5122 [Picea sitchensis]
MQLLESRCEEKNHWIRIVALIPCCFRIRRSFALRFGPKHRKEIKEVDGRVRLVFVFTKTKQQLLRFLEIG